MAGDSGGSQLAHMFLENAAKPGSGVNPDSPVMILMRGSADDSELLPAILELAEKGDSDAQYAAGLAFKNGFGTECSGDDGRTWFARAAEDGHPLALHRMGVCYMLGMGVPESPERALELFEKASGKGLAEASKEIAWMYGTGSGASETKAFGWYLKAAEQGDPEAQAVAGFMYETGEGIGQSYEKAAAWYRKAAEQGLASAQRALGDMYSRGFGLEKSDEKAFGWYLKAAEQGDPEAQAVAGFMYETGKGTGQSYAEAAKWYARSADNGNASAMYRLGRLYEAGLGVPESASTAADYYYGAASRGNGDAGEALQRIEPDRKKAEPVFGCDFDDDSWLPGEVRICVPDDFPEVPDPETENALFDDVAVRFDPGDDGFVRDCLAEFVRCFLCCAKLDPWYGKMPDADLEKAFQTISGRLSGKMKVEKHFRGYYYDDYIVVEAREFISLRIDRTTQERFAVWVSEPFTVRPYIPRPYCTVSEDKLDSFCSLAEYIHGNAGRWKAMAEDRMKR